LAAGPAYATLGDETCSTATDLGAPSWPFALDGTLDSTPDAPDLDYYRLTATPGERLSVELIGTTATGTTSGPMLGQFDADCALLQSNAWFAWDRARLLVTVPADGTVLLAATVVDDRSFTGGGQGPYRLEIRSFEAFTGVIGQIVDATTEAPPPWNTYPTAYLYRCLTADCSSVAYVQGSFTWDGQIDIRSDWRGDPLEIGTYQLHIYAQGYATAPITFTAATGELVDLGAIEVEPIPRLASIGGRVIDGATGSPITSYGYLDLYQCVGGDCSQLRWINYAYVGPWSGDRFFFTTDYYGYPLEVGTYLVQIYAYRYEPFRSAPVEGVAGQDVDFGDLELQPLPAIGSITGRLTDSLTGAPIAGWVRLCGDHYCEYQRPVGADGRFVYETDELGNRLLAGSYWLTAGADQYQAASIRIDVGAGEHRNVGDLAIVSNPIRILAASACASIPSTGGRCTFSVTLVNGQAGALNVRAWSEVEAWGLGSLGGWSRFPAGERSTGFPSGTHGQTRTVSFDFDVPGSTADYASFCGFVFAGEGSSNPYTRPLGARHVFCIQKDPGQGAFQVVTEGEARALARRTTGEPRGHDAPRAQAVRSRGPLPPPH
jgi:hypothetical protein